MSILSQLNSVPMYLICGGIIAFVAVVCVIFLVRAYCAGQALGMDTTKMKRTIISSATFSLLPSVGILLGDEVHSRARSPRPPSVPEPDHRQHGRQP